MDEDEIYAMDCRLKEKVERVEQTESDIKQRLFELEREKVKLENAAEK